MNRKADWHRAFRGGAWIRSASRLGRWLRRVLRTWRGRLTGNGPAESSLSLGRRGELAAARYLKRQRMKIVETGVRAAGGEIDLIAVDRGTVVFIEVKTRKHHQAGHPLEAVDQRKQRQLTRLALAYLKQHGLLNSPARFDVLAMTWPDDLSRPQIQHVRNAFEPTDRWQMFS